MVAFYCSAIRMAIAPKPRVERVNRDLMPLSPRPNRWLGAIYSPLKRYCHIRAQEPPQTLQAYDFQMPITLSKI